jgi:hypothetical protein
MTCQRAQRYISEYVDGALDPGRTATLERHLEGCAACREVLEDFRAMKIAASELPVTEPGDDVWSRIRTGLVRAPAPAGRPQTAPSRRLFGLEWTSPVLRLAGAAALALVLIGSGVFIGTRLGRKTVALKTADPEAYTLAKLDEAETYYQKAIQSLSDAFAAQKGAMVPQVAELFEKNLSVIDATIQACRQAVVQEPDDLRARNYLLAAYMDKLSFLDTALDFQRRNGVPADRGKTL